jgi:hypothetical protein
VSLRSHRKSIGKKSQSIIAALSGVNHTSKITIQMTGVGNETASSGSRYRHFGNGVGVGSRPASEIAGCCAGSAELDRLLCRLACRLGLEFAERNDDLDYHRSARASDQPQSES